MSAPLSAKYTLLAPAIYLAVVVAGLLVFSRIWRKPQKGINSGDAPWFGRHVERELYYSLLAQKNPAADDILLKAALLRRAMEDVKRIWRMREVKPALNQLVARGLVSEDLWSQLLVTEKELEAEIFEVVNEAQTFREGWGPAIFTTASEMAQHEKQKEIVREIASVREKTSLKLERRKARGLSVPATTIYKPGIAASVPATVAAPSIPAASATPIPTSAESASLSADKAVEEAKASAPQPVQENFQTAEESDKTSNSTANKSVSGTGQAAPTSTKSKKSKKNKK